MASRHRRTAEPLKIKAISLAVAACFSTSVPATALANPFGMTVINGQAVPTYNGNVLSITNTPGAIIHWQGFSIGVNEITRFIQQSAASAVLNRVIGIDPSIILGALQSNGRVFLINPNGILFGAGAQIDVAGLVASTLNLSNADFLAGRLRFTDTPGAGSLVNQGAITTPTGGQVYLIAPNVQNTGIITSAQGEVILAAGRSVELVDAGTPNLRVEITAPDTEALNVGQIIANSGKIGIYAGLIRNSGVIRADGVVVGQNGEILLKATRNTTIDAGSQITANGAQGGNITIQSGDTTLVSGTVEAKGTLPLEGGGQGGGGTIKVLGDRVGLIDHANINVSGETGGGTVLIGGDYQGRNPDIQNARQSLVGANASINADAVTSGDGGKVIVWGNDSTQFYGAITARGGAQSGNGGFVETSGHWLDFSGTVNTLAPHGAAGTLLLDPHNIIVAIGGLALLTDVDQFADTPAADSTIAPATINAAASNVVLQANNDVTFTDAVNIATGGVGLTAQAGRSILVDANITTNNGNVTLRANDPAAIALNRDPGPGGITMADGTTISAGTGTVFLQVSTGPGGTPSGPITIENITAFNVEVQQNGQTAGSSILRTSSDALITARNLLLEVDHGGFAGNGSIGAAGAPMRIAPFGGATINFEAHAHEVSPGIFIEAPVAGTNLVIGDVPFFFGGVNGVQTVSSGPIELKVTGAGSTLTTNTGTAGCAFLPAGTGGPICATNGSDSITLMADQIFHNASMINAGGDIDVSGVNFNVGNAAMTQPVTVNAGGDFTANLTGILSVLGGNTSLDASAILHADGIVDVTADGVIVQGGTAVAGGVTPAKANAELSAGDGMILTVGNSGITVAGGTATANAAGGAVRTADANALVSAGTGLTVTVADGGMTIAGGTVRATASNNGSGTATAQAKVTSTSGDVNITVTGNVPCAGGTAGLCVRGGNGASASGSAPGANNRAVADASAELSAPAGNMFLTVTGGMTVAGGDNASIYASYALVNLIKALATAKVSAGGNLTVAITSGGLTVRGGDNASASFSDSGGGMAKIDVSASMTAGGTMTLGTLANPIVGGILIRGGDNARGTASSSFGTHDITVDANARVAGNDVNIYVTGTVAGCDGATAAGLCVRGGDNAYASASVSGAKRVTVNANAELSATNNLTITAPGGIIVRGGDSATASAMGSGASGHVVAVNANALVSAGNQLEIKPGTAFLTVRGGDFASATASDSGRHAATTNANGTLHAGNTMIINVSGAVTVRGGDNASGTASSAGAGGLNTATTNANGLICAGALSPALGCTPGGSLTMTASSLTVRGGNFASASASDDGVNTALVNVNASVLANSMTLTVNGPMVIQGGDSASAETSYGYGSGPATRNTATLNANATVRASSDLTLNVTSGNLTVRGGDNASAEASEAYGISRAETNAKGELSAGGNMTLTVSAGNVTVRGGNNASAEASASSAAANPVALLDATGRIAAGGSLTMNVSGSVQVAGGNNAWASATGSAVGAVITASTNADATISGGSVTLTANSLDVRGGNAGGASATDSGQNSAIVTANGFLLSGGGMSLTVAGPITVAGGSNAYANASGFGGNVNNAAISVGGLIGAGGPLTIVNAGSLTISGGVQSFNSANASGSGVNSAITLANASVLSGGDFNYTGGTVNINGGTARTNGGVGAAGATIAQADAGIGVSGAKTMTIAGSLNITGGSALDDGLDAANGIAQALAVLDPGDMNVTTTGNVNITGGSVTGNGSAYSGIMAAGQINIDIGGAGGLFITGGLTGPVGTGIFADAASPITVTYSGGGMENITVNPALDGAFIQSFPPPGGGGGIPDPVQIVINAIVDSINQSTESLSEEGGEDKDKDKDKDKKGEGDQSLGKGLKLQCN